MTSIIICTLVTAAISYAGLVFTAAGCTAPSRFGWRDGTRCLVGTFITAAVCVAVCSLVSGVPGLEGALIGGGLVFGKLVIGETWNHTDNFYHLFFHGSVPQSDLWGGDVPRFTIDEGHDSLKVREKRWQEIRDLKTIKVRGADAEVLGVYENVEGYPLAIKAKLADGTVYDLYFEENSAARCDAQRTEQKKRESTRESTTDRGLN